MSTLFPKLISVSDLKREAAKLLQELQAGAAPVHVTVHGHPRAVLLSHDQYEALLLGSRSRPTTRGSVAVEAPPAPHRAPRGPQAAHPTPKRLPTAQKYPAFAQVWDNDDDDVYDKLAPRL